MADDDTLLRVTLHVDYGIDVDVIVVFLESLYCNLYAIGYLFIVVKQYLFADNLGYKETGRLIGKLILIEISRTLGQQLLNTLQQHIDAELVLCRDRQYLCLRQQAVPAIDDRCQTCLASIASITSKLINLVDEQDYWQVKLLHFFEEVHIFLRILYYIGYVQQHIGILQCRFRER